MRFHYLAVSNRGRKRGFVLLVPEGEGEGPVPRYLYPAVSSPSPLSHPWWKPAWISPRDDDPTRGFANRG
jgi:hypothetical protein